MTVISAQGDLDLHTTPVFSARLRNAFDWDAGPVTIDLTAVDFLDSTGLATLLNALRRLTRANRRMNVVAPEGSAARRMLWMTRLEETLRVAATIVDAIADHAGRPSTVGRRRSPVAERRTAA